MEWLCIKSEFGIQLLIKMGQRGHEVIKEKDNYVRKMIYVNIYITGSLKII
jgi:hypothetical protein